MISKETFIKNINLIKQNRCQILNICEAIEKAFSSDSYLNPEFFYRFEEQFVDLLAASLEINADCYLMELFYMWIYDNCLIREFVFQVHLNYILDFPMMALYMHT